MTGLSWFCILICFSLWRRKAAQPHQSFPCTKNCLTEALTGDPTKGCPAGKYWIPYPPTAPDRSLDKACRPCPMGYYCPSVPFGPVHENLGTLLPDRKVNIDRRIACPIGQYLDYAGASSLSECKDCETGRYTDWYGQSACKLCPAGKYLDTIRNTKVYDCISCPKGHYCPVGSPKPIYCPVGSYTRYPGMTSVTNCLPCPKAHYCPSGSVEPTPCPAGYYVNQTGTWGEGNYPGTYRESGVMGPQWGMLFGQIFHSCTLCPSGFFCPIKSTVPTSCPAGTHSGTGLEREADCIECPVGHKCQSFVSTDYEQALVVREANLEQMVGCRTADIAPCELDTWIWHYSYPNKTGCTEICPYQIPHQSYCHVAGDGRWPDRRQPERDIMQIVALRSELGRTDLQQQEDALDLLNATLFEMNDAERLEAFRAIDKNGRTALMLASMTGDKAAVIIMLSFGADPKSARDVNGFTAMMLAARMGHEGVVIELERADRPATLAPEDVLRLTELQTGRTQEHVDIGITSWRKKGPMTTPTEYLGRGGLTWGANHPVNASWLIPPTTTTTTTEENATTS